MIRRKTEHGRVQCGFNIRRTLSDHVAIGSDGAARLPLPHLFAGQRY